MSWTEPHTGYGHSIGCWVGIKAILHGARGECAEKKESFHGLMICSGYSSPIRNVSVDEPGYVKEL